jgi:hypothetical protein
LAAATATAIHFNTIDMSHDVSIVDDYKIALAGEGVYSLAFSSQLRNGSSHRCDVTIWLSKNGVAPEHWLTETATDITLGTTLSDERQVAAWNFFVTAQPGDYFVLMIAANGDGVVIDGGATHNTVPPGIPSIPSTMLTVNQVG